MNAMVVAANGRPTVDIDVGRALDGGPHDGMGAPRTAVSVRLALGKIAEA